MVSLSRSDPVQSLLARFRPADTTEEAIMSPAPAAVMVAPDDPASPSTQSREVVRYEPSSQHQTRSQQKRIAAAEGGDLKERLNLITIEAAEAGLARRFCKNHPDQSILGYLRQSGDGVAPHEAAAAVLEDIVEETAETAGGLAKVLRYMQVHGMWKTHPDRTIRSAEDFVAHLDRAGFIRVGFAFATTAQAAKRTSIRRIERGTASSGIDPSWRLISIINARTEVLGARTFKATEEAEACVGHRRRGGRRRDDRS